MSVRHPAVPVLMLIVVSACATLRGGSPAGASAAVRSASGAELGVLRLQATAGGVRISGQLSGLPPGAHGLHVHAVGRCDPPDFATAGPHFNPMARRHGLLNPDGPHAGDLPAIAADANGRATVDAVATLVTLDGGATGLLDADGAALIVHAANDDQRTDPSGNTGARIACGLVVADGGP